MASSGAKSGVSPGSAANPRKASARRRDASQRRSAAKNRPQSHGEGIPNREGEISLRNRRRATGKPQHKNSATCRPVAVRGRTSPTETGGATQPAGRRADQRKSRTEGRTPRTNVDPRIRSGDDDRRKAAALSKLGSAVPEIASILSVSDRTIQRDFAKLRKARDEAP